MNIVFQKFLLAKQLCPGMAIKMGVVNLMILLAMIIGTISDSPMKGFHPIARDRQNPYFPFGKFFNNSDPSFVAHAQLKYSCLGDGEKGQNLAFKQPKRAQKCKFFKTHSTWSPKYS